MSTLPLPHQPSLRGFGRSVLGVLTQIFSFEVLFTLFLFAGRIKGDPRLAWLPFDLTAAFFLLSFAAGGWILLRRHFRVSRVAAPVVGTTVLLILWVVASLAWSEGWIYAQEKSLHFTLLNGWAMVAAAWIIGPSKERRARFLACIVAFGVFIALESVRLYLVRGPRYFITPLGSHYIGLGRTLGMATCALIGVVLSRQVLHRWRILALGIALLFAFVLLVGGARGPLLATVFSVALLFPLSLRIGQGGALRLRRYLAPLTVLVVLAAITTMIVVSATDGQARTLDRITFLFTQEGGGSSAAGRIRLYTIAIEGWLTAPWFGHGVGSFPILEGSGDVQWYPHNIFLELLVELGLVGLVLFLGLLWALAWTVARRWRSVEVNLPMLVLVILFANTFLMALVSGDLNTNRPLFMAMGLLAGALTRANDG